MTLAIWGSSNLVYSVRSPIQLFLMSGRWAVYTLMVLSDENETVRGGANPASLPLYEEDREPLTKSCCLSMANPIRHGWTRLKQLWVRSHIYGSFKLNLSAGHPGTTCRWCVFYELISCKWNSFLWEVLS